MVDSLGLVRKAIAEHPLKEVPALPGRTNDQHAAVLVPIIWRPEPVALLTLRPKSLRAHAGEVCFPGGRPEPQDGSLRQTALREAEEEIGIRGVDVVGRLSAIPLYTSDYRLHPFVGYIEEQPLTPNPGEVERVLHADLAQILASKSIDAIRWEHRDVQSLSPVFVIDDCICYGATAYVMLELLTVVAPALRQTVPPLEPGRFSWEDVLPPGFAP